MNPTRLPAQIPAAIAARLRQIGTVIETAETGALYAPLHPREPYANVHVIRDQAYGDDPRHLLDVFTPQRADDTPRPVFIFVHGGGFVAGNKRSDDSPFYDNLMLWAVATVWSASISPTASPPPIPGPLPNKTSRPPCAGCRPTSPHTVAMGNASSSPDIRRARHTSRNTSPTRRYV